MVDLHCLDDLLSVKLPGIGHPDSLPTLPLINSTQTTANYIVSLLAIYEVDFPGGISMDNIKWRAFIWGLSELLLLLAVAMNYLPCQ